ncbi:MAG TPA: glycosyltransferase family 2 protein [Gemmataceae bacterium]|nr:glycosyltransferase family 2 protein [Gemmataceae bacterium]
MRTAVFIPTWNVGPAVIGALERLPVAFARACAEVFVVDNASTDATVPELCARLRRGFPFPVTVFRNSRNIGYGGSQKVAYAHALRGGYDCVVMLHGDGQYPAEHIPRLVTALEKRGAGMVYGSRMLGSAIADETPWFRRLGVRGLSWLQNIGSGLHLKEWFSGFRAFRCEALRAVPFQACADDYYFDVQIIQLLALAGYTLADIPVPKSYKDNKSPVNIYQFGVQVLSRFLGYPLARQELVSDPLYQPSRWPVLRLVPAPEPCQVYPERAALRAAA